MRKRLQVLYLLVILLSVSLWTGSEQVRGQTISFNAADLQGVSLKNPTSLQFGPDGRLYVAQQNGLILVLTVERTGPATYQVINQETITLIQNIPNHDDDGTLNPSVTTRQVTGILVVGTPSNPVIYVTSSDPRIGAGGGGQDLNLDTNSGILSRLTWVGTSRDDPAGYWDKVDLVRGLPRSEENHSPNGMAYDPTTHTLYIAIGGHTNAGAPSNNFGFTIEYALSAAILSVDLNALEAMPIQGSGDNKYVYDLPTLDDPTRPNANGIDDPSLPGYDGVDINDPFGGNDGLNQAKWDPTGPVQVYATGFRNAYDLVITSNGRMYAVDNGANGGWGGHPDGEADYPAETTVGQCTNKYLAGEPGSTGPGPGGDPKVNNLDNLHFIRELVPGDPNYVQPGERYYAGHPNPIRGNPLGAGLFKDSVWYGPGDPRLPVDWPPVPPALAYAAECDYRQPGVADGALTTFTSSTNGITEYTASNFGGALQGNLLLASFDGNLYRVELSADGKQVLTKEVLASGFGSIPLDVTALGDNAPFPGTIWIANYGSNTITVLEPNDFLICSGSYDPTLDEDGDGYTNADEIDNGTDPCSAASKPADADGDLISDLNDPDDDNDTLPDTADPFAIDASNGWNTPLPVFYNFFNNDPGTGFFGVGLTGLMTNGTADYLTLFDPNNLIVGGTAGLLTIVAVPPGDAEGAANTQQYAFQFGVAVSSTTAPFVVEGQINNPFFSGAPQVGQSQGIFIGTGTQQDFIYIGLVVESGGEGIEVVHETGDVATRQFVPVAGALSSTHVRFFLEVNPQAGTVQPRYALDDGIVQDVGTPLALSGNLLAVVQGTYEAAPGIPSGLAVGVLARQGSSATAFEATWDYLRVQEVLQTSQAIVEVTPTGNLGASTYANGSFIIQNTSTGGEQIVSVRIRLASGMLPDMIFDPDGLAGDNVAKPFTPNSGAVETGLLGHTLLDPHNGVDGSDGYETLEIQFSQFDPGEVFTFSIDVDPNSIKGTSQPGPGGSGSVSGLELVGSEVEITFSNGLTHRVPLFRHPNGSLGGARAWVRSAAPPRPRLEVVGLASLPTTVNDPNQIFRVYGPVGATVKLLVVEAALFEPAGGGYNVAPYDANSVLQVQDFTATLDVSGTADIPVTLTKSDPAGGIHYAVAVVEDPDGMTGLTSNVVVLAYEPPPPPPSAALIRLNTGDGTVTTSGVVWDADAYYSGPSKTYKNLSLPIAGTQDDVLYQTERYSNGGPMVYEIPLPNGVYDVRLHFAEIWWGVKKPGGPGSRVFNVDVENGQGVLTNFDIIAEAGAPATALIKTFNGIGVTDGALTIVFTPLVNNAKISAIEILTSGPRGVLVVSPTSLDFGQQVVGTTASQTLTLTNQGTADLTEILMVMTGPQGTEFTVSTNCGTLAPGATCTATVTYTPVTLGAVSATLSIHYHDGTGIHQEKLVPITGEGVSTPTYTLTITTVGNGTVTKNPDQTAYESGTVVQLTAVPAAGWVFSNWSGDLSGSDNPVNVTVTTDMNITATFIELPSADNFLATLTVTDATGESRILSFGTANGATDGFDAAYDQKAPPLPPPGAFEARFLNGGEALYKDVRASVVEGAAVQWTLQFQPATGGWPVVISWNPLTLPPGSFRLQDTGGGTQVDVNMKTQHRYVADSGAPTTLVIQYVAPTAAAFTNASVNLETGWNLVGLPLDVADGALGIVFPTAEPGALFAYEGKYEAATHLVPGRGYWLNSTQTVAQTVQGYAINNPTYWLESGWNLLAVPSCTINLPLDATEDPAGLVTTVYEYGGAAVGYQLATALSPGQGYWVQATAAGMIRPGCDAPGKQAAAVAATTLSAASDAAVIQVENAAGGSRTLYLTTEPVVATDFPAYLLPPLPPGKAFDVRFDGDSRLAGGAEALLQIQAAPELFPLRLVLADAPGEGTLTVQEMHNESPGRTHVLTPGQTLALEDAQVTALRLVWQPATPDLPDAIQLHANYPNPFRTETYLVLDLPEPGEVEVEVFDLLGRRVYRLTQPVAAGYQKRIRLDLRREPSGTYLYRVTVRTLSETYTRVGRMMRIR
ncbi:malectin domain-containing carbohydrate-binding protein [Rhodothermus profundi]|uniref:Por secretion system C-terminal sorting domain-containing protein n=1 Tax=Rhodothermus profundi TaxID=633813 RepID=A0A1M6XJB6_9BACT|nr:malectin domain-containing carbohydrate-binding protein [Rhodothermus profundi]SHL05998.1 Por secretion system C-terminal sorting domain-containing protein [Rhodothermus profundi]